jgi:hypothetical protein
MNTATSLRDKLYDYIRVADDKKLHAIYCLLENEIVDTKEWWKDKKFVPELDSRYDAMEKGTDKGFTFEQIEASITKLRKNKYGK